MPQSFDRGTRPAPAQSPTKRPWWREPIMWLVVGGPALVVVAGIVTAVLAASGADPVLAPTYDPDKAAMERAMQPAQKARNAASTDAANAVLQKAPPGTDPQASGASAPKAAPAESQAPSDPPTR